MRDIKAKKDNLHADWAKIDADREKRKGHIKGINEIMERREVERKADDEKMMAELEVERKIRQADFEKRMAKWKADLDEVDEPTSVYMQSQAEHREVSKEHAAVETGKARKEGRMKRKKVGGRRQLYRRKLMERTRENWGFLREFGQGHAKVARGTRKRWTLGRRQLLLQEGINGTMTRDIEDSYNWGARGQPSGATGRLSGWRS
jgi:hypothetical protein